MVPSKEGNEKAWTETPVASQTAEFQYESERFYVPLSVASMNKLSKNIYSLSKS